MIITGDIAQPKSGASSFELPMNLKNQSWIGNLEGSLIEGGNMKSGSYGVFNDIIAVEGLLDQIPFKSFIIANNHLLDYAQAHTTINNAEELGISTVGAGDLREAQKSLVLTDIDKTSYRILAFGWESIQCIPAKIGKPGVNPYTRKNVLYCVKTALQYDDPLICFFHWDYELERYPQPYDRHMAMELIDMGVSAVIGCHSHRTQPIEFYKGKPIVYGLGNFLFCQDYYFGGGLRFPEFCEDEYAFEFSRDGYKLHYFHYDGQINKLEYVNSVEISEDKEFDGKAVFSCYSEKEYEQFFKENRVQKKLLPIFKTNESAVSYWLKSEWIRFRGWILDTAMRLNLKSANRAHR